MSQQYKYQEEIFYRQGLALLQPYLVALMPDQRKTLPKMGDGNLPFVQDSLQFALSDAQFAPPFLNVSELQKDVLAVQALTPIDNMAVKLASLLNDTMMLAGSEAYIATLAYYNSVKTTKLPSYPIISATIRPDCMAALSDGYSV